MATNMQQRHLELRRGSPGECLMERPTATEHGLTTAEVYRPGICGTVIGEVKDREKIMDLALVQLHSSFRYTDTRYQMGPGPGRDRGERTGRYESKGGSGPPPPSPPIRHYSPAFL